MPSRRLCKYEDCTARSVPGGFYCVNHPRGKPAATRPHIIDLTSSFRGPDDRSLRQVAEDTLREIAADRNEAAKPGAYARTLAAQTIMKLVEGQNRDPDEPKNLNAQYMADQAELLGLEWPPVASN